MGVRRVLITGAAGHVGRHVVPHLRSAFELRLSDRNPHITEGAAATADIVSGDLLDESTAAAAVRGTDAVVHLAGNPDYNAEWDDVAGANVTLTERVLGAALGAGVRRVVVASSLHAMGGYIRAGATAVEPEWPPRPCCRYGASKVAAEALGRVYAERYGLAVTCLRLGWVTARPSNATALDLWLSPRDAAELIRCALASSGRWGAHFGVSANTRRRWSIDSATDELGYRPADDAERLAADLDKAAVEGDRVCFT